jgi:hypothetical protein
MFLIRALDDVNGAQLIIQAGWLKEKATIRQQPPPGSVEVVEDVSSLRLIEQHIKHRQRRYTAQQQLFLNACRRLYHLRRFIEIQPHYTSPAVVFSRSLSLSLYLRFQTFMAGALIGLEKEFPLPNPLSLLELSGQ